jgi:hypothetical protein
MPGAHKWDETTASRNGVTPNSVLFHAKRCLPFFDAFMDTFKEDNTSVIGAKDVYHEYVLFVEEQTKDVQTLTAARVQTVFLRRFKPEALRRKWPERCSADGRRCFLVSRRRSKRVVVSRRVSQRVVDAGAGQLAAVNRYLQTPGNAWQGFWHRVNIDDNKKVNIF